MSLERSTVPSCLRNSFETVTANKNHNTRNGMLVRSVWLGYCVLILTVWIKLLKSRMEVQNKVSRSHIFSLARHSQKLDQTLGLCFQPPEKKKKNKYPVSLLFKLFIGPFLCLQGDRDQAVESVAEVPLPSATSQRAAFRSPYSDHPFLKSAAGNRSKGWTSPLVSEKFANKYYCEKSIEWNCEFLHGTVSARGPYQCRTLCQCKPKLHSPDKKAPLDGWHLFVLTRRLHPHQQPSPGCVSCWTAALCPPHLPLPATIGPLPDCNSALLEIDLYKLHRQSRPGEKKMLYGTGERP